jgi:hypothetical protein
MRTPSIVHHYPGLDVVIALIVLSVTMVADVRGSSQYAALHTQAKLAFVQKLTQQRFELVGA